MVFIPVKRNYFLHIKHLLKNDMDHISKVITSSNLPKLVNDNNDIRNNTNIVNNVNNDTDVKKYSLKPDFVPRSEKTMLAKEMSDQMEDPNNYAFYLSVVNKLGISEAKRLLAVVQNDIREKAKTKTPVRHKGKFFAYIYKFRKY